MSDGIPRLRMFAGPNGSGKTTVKNGLRKPHEWFGLYINPDELEKTVRETGRVSCVAFGLTVTQDEVRHHFVSSEFLRQSSNTIVPESIVCHGDDIEFRQPDFNSYHASVLSDFLRRKALDESQSFTFETVMSAPDKVELLREARGRGFRTYLYFIATDDPAINIQRVNNRVAAGGHSVPADKIVSRYHRSLGLLPSAIIETNRAYFFDTSGDEPWYFAEASDGPNFELKSGEMPSWFEPIWDRFDPDSARRS